MEILEPKAKPIEILFSYTREDEDLRDKLETHLASLKRQQRIVCWHDRHIRAGNIWNLHISTQLDSADIILLLISPDFINSDYCNRVEVKRALERHEKGEVCVVPVILRPADWKEEKFAKFQALPRDAQPIVLWPHLDVALYNVAKGLKEIIVEIEKARGLPVE
jgi:TIR domain